MILQLREDDGTWLGKVDGGWIEMGDGSEGTKESVDAAG